MSKSRLEGCAFDHAPDPNDPSFEIVTIRRPRTAGLPEIHARNEAATHRTNAFVLALAGGHLMNLGDASSALAFLKMAVVSGDAARLLEAMDAAQKDAN